jgi:hypothetical protein
MHKQPHTRWVAIGVLATALALGGCADKSSEAELTGPAKLVAVKGRDVPQVVITDKKAIERLGLEYGAVAEAAGSKSIPYAAVVYDSEGNTWTYTSPKALTFERTPITVASITGDEAKLTAGPPAGTEVVTVGAAELLGVEAEIGY